MLLSKFEYIQPKTIDEVCTIISEHKDEARLIAGGTDLLPLMKLRLLIPLYLIDIKSIPDLEGIKYSDEEGLRIGPLALLHSMENSEIIREKFPILAQAAGEVGAFQIKHMGTIGGNINQDTRCWYYNQSHFWRQSVTPCYKRGGNMCHVMPKGADCYAAYQGDLAPALIGLDAKIKLVKKGGERIISLKDFYTGNGSKPTVLESEEILTEIQIPPVLSNSKGSYKKLRWRETLDFPMAGVAAVLSLENGACSNAQIVLGAVGSGPIKASGAEDLIKGKKIKEIDDDLLERIAELASKDARPVYNMIGSPDYRRKMIGLLSKKAIREALQF